MKRTRTDWKARCHEQFIRGSEFLARIRAAESAKAEGLSLDAVAQNPDLLAALDEDMLSLLLAAGAGVQAAIADEIGRRAKRRKDS